MNKRSHISVLIVSGIIALLTGSLIFSLVKSDIIANGAPETGWGFLFAILFAPIFLASLAAALRAISYLTNKS